MEILPRSGVRKLVMTRLAVLIEHRREGRTDRQDNTIYDSVTPFAVRPKSLSGCKVGLWWFGVALTTLGASRKLLYVGRHGPG